MSPLSSLSPLSPLSPPSPFAKIDGGSLKLSKKSSNLGGKVKIHLPGSQEFCLGVVFGSRGVEMPTIDALFVPFGRC